MRRAGFILGVALLCGLVASYLVARYVRQQEQLARAATIELRPVVVAAADIPLGARVSTDLVAVRAWPKAGVPQGAVSEPHAIVGRVAKGAIARDEPLLEHRLFPKDLTAAPGVMSVIVPPGKRAMTVGVNEVIGVSGFILPKNRVDVIATRTDAGTSKASETILQHVEVLAVGHRLEQKGEQHVEVPTVTLAVTPEEAERLALALHEGKIHIVLRSILDRQVVPVLPLARRNAAVGTQHAGPRPAVAERRGGKTFVVEVIRGGNRTVETHPLE